ncbi:hypothetical protein NMG90_17665 [Bacillus mycoides]|uniref:hypothetical protein n=1 Tax=Bacillus mycoides TaxID=1405 RepID=UPI0009940114|nr:hypothetical protein [Bacillus mycoides]MCP9227231.1 hypothetical protein [Bacillus mycoides]OOR67543.1 hypothetical protein BLW98_16290 [Bacillus mycoides]OOR67601.1 hypothetical protein BLW98_16600 [Bacillus mycoides]
MDKEDLNKKIEGFIGEMEKELKDKLKIVIKEDKKEIIKCEVEKEMKKKLKKEIKKIKKTLTSEAEKEARAEVFEEVKKDMSEFIDKEIENENSLKDYTFKRIVAGIVVIFLYIGISYAYLWGAPKLFDLLKNSNAVNENIKGCLGFAIILLFTLFYIKVAHTLYRFKQNPNTVFYYGLLEVAFGVVSIGAAVIAFNEQISGPLIVDNIKVVTYFAFYSALYVIVRGFETIQKNADNKNNKVFFLNLSKETLVSKWLSSWLAYK